MGAQFINYQVKCDSQADAVKIVRRLSSGKCYVSPPEKGWISIYDEMSENYYNPNLYEYIVNFASSMSGYLNTSVFAFVVFNGVDFLYFLYKKGDLLDEFCCAPKLSYTFGFKKYNQDVEIRFQGAPEKLLPYSISGTTIENIIKVVNSIKKAEDNYLGEDGILHLVPLFGMNEYKAIQGYKYFENQLALSEEERDIKDAEEFIFLDCSKGREE